MMKNYDESFEINHNPNWLYISDCLYRILIIGYSGSDKTNVLLNSIKHQRPDWQHLFICQNSIQIKVPVAYQWKRKIRY